MSHPKDSSKTPDFQKLGHEANQCARAIVKLVEQQTGKELRMEDCSKIVACVTEAMRFAIQDSESTRSRLVEALQAILDESQQHAEYNSVSGITRLPKGYTKIMNMADSALSAAHKGGDK